MMIAASTASWRKLPPQLTKLVKAGGALTGNSSLLSKRAVHENSRTCIEPRFFSTAPAVPTQTSSLGQQLSELASSLPYKDVLHYEPRPQKVEPIKFTLGELNHFSNALASGLLEIGFVPGDKIVSWLPTNIAETPVLQFACSKAGLILYQVDSDLTDASAICDALDKTQAVCLFFPEFGEEVNYVNLVKEAVPEIDVYDCRSGHPFFTPRFPNLRMVVHDGMEQKGKRGMVPYYHLYVPDGPVEKQIKRLGKEFAVEGSTPVLGEIGSDKVLTTQEVLDTKAWPEVASVLSKDYLEIGYNTKAA